MTRWTEDSLKSHDLKSTEVINWLKLGNLGNPDLIEEITSRLYGKVLQAIDSKMPLSNDWQKIDKKLRRILRTQVEIVGRLYLCEEILDKLFGTEPETLAALLNAIIYEFNFLALDLSTLFYELEYSTWNLLDFLSPRYYFDGHEIPASLLHKFADDSLRPSSKLQSALNEFCEKLLAKGIDKRIIEAARVSLGEWLQQTQKYKQLLDSFYEAEAEVETLYAFHCAISVAIHLLSLSLLMKLSLQPISDQMH